MNFELYEIVLDHQSDYDTARNEMIRLANGKTTVPQIFINGSFIEGGFTGLKQVDDAGLLNTKLTEASPIRFDNQLNLKMARLMAVNDMDF